MSCQWPGPFAGWPDKGPERDQARRLIMLSRRLEYVRNQPNKTVHAWREIAALKWAIDELVKLYPVASNDLDKFLAREALHEQRIQQNSPTTDGADEQQPSQSDDESE